MHGLRDDGVLPTERAGVQVNRHSGAPNIPFSRAFGAVG